MQTIPTDPQRHSPDQPFDVLLTRPIEYDHHHQASGQEIREWRGTTVPPWRLFNGSAKETLDLIDDASIDCVVTSPPYFWLRDYKVNGQIGLESSVEAYTVALTEIMNKVRLKLKPEGVLFLNLGDTYEWH